MEVESEKRFPTLEEFCEQARREFAFLAELGRARGGPLDQLRHYAAALREVGAGSDPQIRYPA